MKRFKNILVIVNDDKHPSQNPALVRALALSKANEARLTLMSVVKPPERAISEFKDILEPEELTDMLVSDRKNALDSIAEKLGSNIDIRVCVAVGKDFIETIRRVILGKHDLLMKVANEHPDSFDSSDFHLMRKCPEPVWLFKRKIQSRSLRVLAAVDLVLESYDEGRLLNRFIMDLATSLTQWNTGKLHVLSCWSLYGENSLRDSGFAKIPEEKIAHFLHQEEQANVNRQKTLIANYQSIDIEAHLHKGDPVDIIPKFSKRNEIEVVVMGTVARSGIPGLLIGNTAETILHMIDASVITLKPSGFESPIR